MMSIETKETAHIDRPGYTPVTALIFHELQHSHHEKVLDITTHPIKNRGKGHYLGAGRSFTHADLDALLHMLRAQSTTTRSLLPDNLLLQGTEELAWYVPGSIRPMWVGDNDRTKRLNVPWPTLIFHARSGRLSIAAMKGSRHPDSNTPVSHAPVMNIYNSGNVCTGNADLPPDCTIESMKGWEDVIYRTRFTHVNHDFTLRFPKKSSVSTPDHYKWWCELERSGAKRFPSASLVPMGKKLGEFLSAGIL